MPRTFVALFVLLSLAAMSLVLAGGLRLSAAAAGAGRRVALVIGNGGYDHGGTLTNPPRDAAAMAKLFGEAGFTSVEVRTDLGLRAFSEALADFEVLARDADVAVVYFSGHGLELGGQNYLVPVDADIKREVDVKYQTLPLDRVLDAVAGATRLKLVILDACRSDPFKAVVRKKSVSKGLARIEPPEANELVAYAARAGTAADDGTGGNSPYTTALLRRLAAPGVDIEFALRQVRDDVLAATHREQEPFTYGSLGGVALPLVPSGAPTSAGPSADEVTWRFIQGGSDAALFESFAKTYPSSPHAAEALELAEKHRPRLAAVSPPAPAVHAPCGGATLASLETRAPGVLTAGEECALKRGDAFKECADCPTMVVVPAGRFTMGSPASEPFRYEDEGPQHDVTIAREFAVGKFPVTVDEFRAFVRETGYDAGSKCYAWTGKEWKLDAGRSWRNPGYEQTGSHPVVCVNWKDARAYVTWLSKRTGKAYRLLSEAEWEYAARGRTEPGSYPRYFFGEAEADMCRYGNGADATAKKETPGASWTAPCTDGYAYTSPVASFVANDFGLHDMHGNAFQWVEDCYTDNYVDAPSDGTPRLTGDCSRRILRGGSWNSNPSSLRAAVRSGTDTDSRYFDAGFRVARAPGMPER